MALAQRHRPLSLGTCLGAAMKQHVTDADMTARVTALRKQTQAAVSAELAAARAAAPPGSTSEDAPVAAEASQESTGQGLDAVDWNLTGTLHGHDASGDWPEPDFDCGPASPDEFDVVEITVANAIAKARAGTGLHVEARRLLGLGFKLVQLKPMDKRPVGNGWQLNPVQQISDAAGGYGLMLAANGLCSIDPDDLDRAREGLKRCGFDLNEIMAAGARTSSTRPGSGGRSTFRAPSDLSRIVFRTKSRKTLLELRAGRSNLQDCLPGTVYMTKDGGGPYVQAYAGLLCVDQAPELPAAFLAWWRRLQSDLGYLREQEALFCGVDDPAALSISAGKGTGAKLAYASPLRVEFNETHDVEDILARHGYVDSGNGRWAPPGATGAPCVRLIPGHDDLWQSDHGSDPLLGTFDAWVANVTLDYDGDVATAEAAFRVEHSERIRQDFDVVEADASSGAASRSAARHPVALDWSSIPEHPEEPAFVIPGWLPLGTVTLFAAHGGTGKSFMSLYIALCLATGRHPFSPNDLLPRTKTLVYSAEDNLSTMQWRLRRYMQLLGIAPKDLDGWLLVLDATESDNVLFAGDARHADGRTTARFDWLKQQVDDFEATVLIFDNASDALDANENERAKVRQFMGAMKRLAPAVLLLAHVDAISSMADPNEAKGYSGSTAWHNSARSRWFMARQRDSENILLTLPKVNYAKAGSEVVLRWSDADKVFRVISAREGIAKAQDSRAHLLGLLREVTDVLGETVSPAVNTSRSVFNAIKDLPGFPSGLKSRDVAREVMSWRTEGLVQVEQYMADNRKPAERLVLTPAGREIAICNGSHADDMEGSSDVYDLV
ncbi:hypothetical protein ENE75_03550 [Rubrivivax albus]|uniref:Uncharacterized protein n=1 Tax=Rubrivivax albus TaxID=2499835 RepID=A0A3S2U589_9BURK|nr:hypothetical protein ENE75_03550 [Rubrivivax albus]